MVIAYLCITENVFIRKLACVNKYVITLNINNTYNIINKKKCINVIGLGSKVYTWKQK